ncbi:MAG TPA: hypothetical protein PK090_06560 [Smithellaceae bacterium]|nr:hypothetical protein [Smithellaceae bacterium]
MNPLIWVRNVVVLLLSIFFLVFGIHLLVGAFSLTNPFEFVMTIFSASFVILFCLVGIVYVVFRILPRKPDNGLDDVEIK